MNNVFISIKEDLLTKLVQENINKKSLLIVPSESNKKFCLQLVQKMNILTPLKIESMQNFKNYCFIPTIPLLKEDKRTIALFQAISKKVFKQTKAKDYFQFVTIANNFFQFWNEYNEESLSDKVILEVLNENGENQWQTRTFSLMIEMKNDYEHYLTKIGFSDMIFEYKTDTINTNWFDKFEELILANQYYLTNLEKKILNKHKNVTHFIQCEKEDYDSAKEEIRKINLRNVINDSAKIEIFKTHDSITMANTACRELRTDSEPILIDFNFVEKEYSKYIPSEIIAKNNKKSMTETSLFSFISSLRNLIESFSNKKSIYIPIVNIIKFIEIEVNQKWLGKIDYDSTIAELFRLIDYDIIYLDEKHDWKRFTKNPQNIEKLLELLFKKLEGLSELNTVTTFIKAFHTNEIFDTNPLISEQERKYSNLFDKFYETLSDFALIEQLNLVINWDKFWLNSQGKFGKFQVLLRLFLEYCKAKEIQWDYKYNKGKQITNLADTRNLHYKKIMILSCNEGTLPPSQKTPFLFTETQREKLGLKTYEQIVKRQHYYFTRLFANAEVVKLFGIENIDQNVDISSFVEEILIDLKNQTKLTIINNEPSLTLVKTLLENSRKINKKTIINNDFFKFKNNNPKDNIYISYSDWYMLEKNPFIFYIERKLKFREKILANDLKISIKQLGNFVHEIFEKIWIRLSETFINQEITIDFTYINKEYIRKAIDSCFLQGNYNLQIPHNYSEKFFKEFIIPMIENSILYFFHFLDKSLKISNKNLAAFIEKTSNNETELFEFENGAKAFLKGRADLILEGSSEIFVIDFKTGSGSENQLIFYEWIYYLLNQPLIADKINSMLYNVRKRDFTIFSGTKINPKEKKRDKLKIAIVNVLEEIRRDGFINKAKYKEQKEITRRDLMHELEVR